MGILAVNNVLKKHYSTGTQLKDWPGTYTWKQKV